MKKKRDLSYRYKKVGKLFGEKSKDGYHGNTLFTFLFTSLYKSNKEKREVFCVLYNIESDQKGL